MIYKNAAVLSLHDSEAFPLTTYSTVTSLNPMGHTIIHIYIYSRVACTCSRTWSVESPIFLLLVVYVPRCPVCITEIETLKHEHYLFSQYGSGDQWEGLRSHGDGSRRPGKLEMLIRTILSFAKQKSKDGIST